MERKTNGKGFRALLTTQFLGAFNDNAFKFVIAALIIDSIDQSSGETLFLALSGAVFILPFIVFSTLAGFLADRFSKRRVIIGAKILELVVMGAGLAALISGHIVPMLVVLFFMGLQSALLSPSKYGILPEILNDQELSEGNGQIQMWTYVAILLGQTCYGFIMHYTSPHPYKAAYVFIAVSILGIFTSLFITKVKPSGSVRPLEINVFKEIAANIQWIKQDRSIFLSIIGLMYFGFLGGLFQPNVLLYARQLLQINHLQTGFLISSMTVGIGLGCILAGKLSDKKVELGLVPLGSIGLSFFAILMGFSAHSFVMAVSVIFLLGLSCGFYIVPLNTLIQQGSPRDRRGQVLATNTFLSFTAILTGSLFLYVLRDIFHLNAAQIFIFIGCLTIGGTIYITSLLPYAFVRFLIWMFTHSIYKIRTRGLENVPEKGGALLVCNHISYIDALMLVVTVQRPIRFMVYKNIYEMKTFNPILRLAKAIPISGKDNPKELIRSINRAKQALRDGELVCIFPEGQLTRTGNMLKFNRGMERIMQGVSVPIVPVNLDRVWGSIFSYERGRYFMKWPKTIPYPITVSYGPPMPSDSSAFAVRNQIMELSADSFCHRLDEKLTLPEAFWQEARKHPFRFCMADSNGKSLNYLQTLITAVTLSKSLKKRMGGEEKIGVLLPPTIVGVLTNITLAILNKVPVNLNYTASKEALVSTIHQCGMKNIISSRIFLEKTKIALTENVIYIEDLIKNVSALDKIKGLIQSILFPSRFSYLFIFGKRSQRSMDQLATVMFTSGSTGDPKGVKLTHANIISNLEGLYQVFHVNKKDCVMGVLPLFHSFGFTATMWFPLISGIGVVYHANPLDAKMISKLVQRYRATILMATPTFLNAYIRRCEKEQFQSLRLVVVGAEKMKEQTAQAFKDKFGLEPMEGYGCTELSPIVSLNLPDYRENGVKQKAYKPGKIGLPLPGIAVRIVHQETMQPAGANENGLLYIKGPNVMQGYLNKEALTNEVLIDGWYKTGDIANLDEDGFLMITDRLSRFSKIAGEMVPHVKIEETIQEILNASEQVCAVTSVPDEKKGEQLAVLCLKDIDTVGLVDELRRYGLPNLWIPDAQNFIKIDAIPLLGSGKMDLGKIKQIAKQCLLG
ncbi:MAG: MFS transporter [Candidatus Omnitrophica bacterium]|nr:MFS transporter [Candidatus Omnitrophota bacterium]MCB9748070.1 MFS transporter [Candidatus Omnitrophota bacterium]